jgi:two-component system nitrate/nitrite response regulator NarL
MTQVAEAIGTPGELRVLVVANDPLARTGLASLLANQPGCAVVGQVAGDSDLHQALDVYRPDVVLWDMLSPATAIERLVDFRDEGRPVVALIADEAAAADVWSAGARGVLLREASPESMTAALRSAAEGLAVFDPTFVPPLSASRTQPSDRLTEELTPREREVLQLLARGHSNKEIARQLGISEHTVKFHVNSILGKLNVQSRTEAVVRATRLGLVLL